MRYNQSGCADHTTIQKLNCSSRSTSLMSKERNTQDRAFSLSVVSDPQHGHEMNGDEHIKVFVLLICRGNYSQVDSMVSTALRHNFDPS